MALSSLTYFLWYFSFNWFIPILHILRKKNHLNIYCSEIWTEIIFDPRWLSFLLAEISNGKKKRICWNVSMQLRNQIDNQVSNYRLLRASCIIEVLLYGLQHQILCKNEYRYNNFSKFLDYIEHWTQTWIWIMRWAIHAQVSL